MKICITCHIEKSLSLFWNLKRHKDWKSNVCKECKRLYDNIYYKELKLEKKRSIYKTKWKRRKNILIKLNEYLLLHWCIDCWYKENRAALQFDHIWEKRMNVSEMVWLWLSLEKIMEEVKKCVVRCANYHHIKTAKDFNWYNLED